MASVDDNPCLPFAEAPVAVREEYTLDGEVFPPHCAGEWVSGSGGHRVHSGVCLRPVTWYHPDDSFAYCDAHIPAIDKPAYRALWARTLRIVHAVQWVGVSKVHLRCDGRDLYAWAGQPPLDDEVFVAGDTTFFSLNDEKVTCPKCVKHLKRVR